MRSTLESGCRSVIVVTGGLGVIGSRYVDQIDPCIPVTVIDHGPESRNEWTANRIKSSYPGTSIRRTRVEEFDWESLGSSVTRIVHAAAHTGIPHSAEDPDDDWRSNVDATRSILEWMRKTKSSATLVALSSVKPYRVPVPIGNGVDEEVPLEPDEPYAASKMAQSGLVMAYARSYGLNATVLRCSNLYGDAPCHGPRHGWLTWFCIAAAIGRTINVQGSGDQSRDMLYCTDVSSAINAATDNIGSTRGNVYNIGGGTWNVVSVNEAVQTLQSFGADVKVSYSFGREHEDMAFVTNHNKFTGATGWVPKVSLTSGMETVYRWAVANADDLRKMYEGV